MPDPERSIAASIYKLPFTDKYFDKIVSYRVFEHINFEKALPELLRVLKEGGEIRMAALQLSVFPAEKRILPDVLEFDFYGMSAEWVNHLGLENSLDLMVNNESISSYILVGGYHKAKVARRFPNIRKGTILIIRKDKKWPEITQIKNDKDPYIGKIMRITKEKPKKDKETRRQYYKLSFHPKE